MSETGKNILITGANGGLGIAIAEAFLLDNPGHHLMLGVRTRRDQAEALCGRHPNRCKVVSLDVTDPSSWKKTVSDLAQPVQVLVNNAGFHSDALLATMPQHMWNDVIEVNLNGVFHGCQAVLPRMIEQRFGRIINIASLSALLAPAGQSNYAAAKAGVVALTQSLAKEVARIGITVNAICPGYLDTDAIAGMDAEARKAAVARIPMRRFGRPSEVASAVRFLACAEAGYITGSVLKIDGGIF